MSSSPNAASAPTESAARSADAPAGPTQRELLLRIFGYLRHIPTTAVIAGAVVLARAGVEVWSVWYLKTCVTAVKDIAAEPPTAADEATGFWDWLAVPDGPAAELRVLLLWTLAAQALLAWTIYLRNVWDGKFSMYAVFYIRQAVYDRFQSIGFSVHDRMTSGQLINRALSDLQNVRMFLNLSVLGVLDIVAYVVGYVGLLMVCSPWLALGLLVPVPLWWLLITRFSRRAQPLYESQQEAADNMMTGLTENIAGVHVVRSFGTEPLELAKYRKLNDDLLDRLFAMVRLQQWLTPSLRGVAVAAHVGLFLGAAYLIQIGEITIGDLLPIGLAINTILAKLQQVNVLVETYQKAVVSSRRLFEVLDIPAATASTADAPALSWRNGDIEFRNVVFGYDAAKPVLRGVNARVPGQKFTALVGPTGAGKSTLVSLLGRFYDPQAGQILIDGQDIAAVNLTDLRRQVGYVFQETFLFSDSIRNNIRYGRADVSDEMVEAAAEAAQAADFIRELPEGYDTLLGERGLTLSGGQRQRLALARALVYDPKILILDDATAALDPETEQIVSTILGLLYAGRTVLMIAHRVSTVRRADYVLVVEHGQVVQAGTHQELMATDGHYREVTRMQLARDDNSPV